MKEEVTLTLGKENLLENLKILNILYHSHNLCNPHPFYRQISLNNVSVIWVESKTNTSYSELDFVGNAVLTNFCCRRMQRLHFTGVNSRGDFGTSVLPRPQPHRKLPGCVLTFDFLVTPLQTKPVSLVSKNYNFSLLFDLFVAKI